MPLDDDDSTLAADPALAVTNVTGSGPPTPAPYLAPGTAIGRYRIEARLGAGGMGIVYRARDTELDRAVALKLVRPQAGELDELTERLRRESRLQSRAAHRSVITVYDIGRDGDQVYVAMELIRGGTLREWLARAKPSWRDILDAFRSAAEGLAAAHAAGMVHRDFKADNVLVEMDGDAISRVLVTDFGVARAVEATEHQGLAARTSDVHLTAAGTLIGTPAYMSPEQLRTETVDARSDVFSFCVVLWEALYGERPFQGRSIDEILERMKAPAVPPPGAAVPRWLLGVLRAGLATDLDRRIASMAELIDALDWKRRRRRLWVTGSALAFVGAAGSALAVAALWPGPPSPCDGPDPADARLAASIVRVTLPAAEIPSDLLGAWRTTLDRQRTGRRHLRESVCAAPRAANVADRIRCLDRMGLHVAGTLSTIAGLEPNRRIDAIETQPFPLPAECLTDAAGVVGGLIPVDPASVRAETWLRIIDRVDDVKPQELEETRALVRAARFPPLDRYLALALAETSRDPIEGYRTTALEARRAGDPISETSAWLRMVQRLFERQDPLDRVRDVLGQADLALSRAGDPPAARSLWYSQRAVASAMAHDATAALADAKRANDLLEQGGMPASLLQQQNLAAAYLHAGRPDLEHELFDHVIATVAPRPGTRHLLLTLRNNHAVGLLEANQPGDAVRTVIEPILRDVDRTRRLPDAELLDAVEILVKSYTSSGEFRAALDALESWRGAIEATGDRDSLVIGELEMQRAISLAVTGQNEPAELAARRALDIFLVHLGASHQLTADMEILDGQILQELGRPAAAVELLQRGIAAYPDSPKSGRTAEGRLALAEALLALGRADEAREPAELGLERFRTLADVSPADLANAERIVARTRAVRPTKR
ncbi:MAG TPA: serine/threonine-protein kinase [Kofleriaceae bacterium]|nr:serine/threonine-protein kinase [Kofleriaceae bacterium]